jgi:hypothetical protein
MEEKAAPQCQASRRHHRNVSLGAFLKLVPHQGTKYLMKVATLDLS